MISSQQAAKIQKKLSLFRSFQIQMKQTYFIIMLFISQNYSKVKTFDNLTIDLSVKNETTMGVFCDFSNYSATAATFLHRLIKSLFEEASETFLIAIEKTALHDIKKRIM